MLQSDTVNYIWRDISRNEVKRASRLVFHLSPTLALFPYPSFPIPQHPYPLPHSPRPPRICRGSANERSTAVFLPRDKNLKVWCNPSLRLSCCFTPIRCAAPNDSASWSYRIGTLCGFVVTTPGHDNCLPGKAMCMFKKKQTLKMFAFPLTESRINPTLYISCNPTRVKPGTFHEHDWREPFVPQNTHSIRLNETISP